MIPVFTAYILITMNRADRSTSRYHGVNLTDAFCICINALVNTAYPSAPLNILWANIAVLGL